MAVRIHRASGRLTKIGGRFVAAEHSGCCCGDGGGGGGNWPTTNYVVASPCPGEPPLVPGELVPVFENPSPGQTGPACVTRAYEFGGVTRCVSASPASPGIQFDGNVIPPGYVGLAWLDQSCCACRWHLNRAPKTCIHGQWTAAANTIRSMYNSGTGAVTVSGWLGRYVRGETNAPLRCCCGPLSSLSHAFVARSRQYTDDGFEDVIEYESTGSEAVEPESVLLRYRRRRTLNGNTGGWSDFSIQVDTPCGPLTPFGESWPTGGELQPPGWTLSASLTCDSLSASYRMSADGDIATYNSEWDVTASVSRGLGVNQCGEGCGGSSNQPGEGANVLGGCDGCGGDGLEVG